MKQGENRGFKTAPQFGSLKKTADLLRRCHWFPRVVMTSFREEIGVGVGKSRLFSEATELTSCCGILISTRS